VSELLSPVSGTVIAINVELEDSPSLVNDDPHRDGWLVEVDLSDPAELDELMSSEQYEALVAEA
jgi:glycine cleavage system H protein